MFYQALYFYQSVVVLLMSNWGTVILRAYGTKCLKITENTAVHVDESLELSCSATHENNSLRISGRSGVIANIHGSMNESKWSVLKNDDHHLEIIIKVTQLSDGDTYRCDDIRNQGLNFSTQVVVLDHSPNCSLNTSRLSVKEFEEVSMRCSTGYRGDWAPSIHWQDDNGQRITAGVTNVTSSSHVTSLLNLTASASHHGVVYSCVILFENRMQIVPANVWSNTPSYRRNCSLPALNVSFGARNILINPLKDSYKSGESVSCSAEGNPTPTCHWYNIRTNNTSGDMQHMLHITASMNETVHFYKCLCSNDIGASRNISFNVTGTTSITEGDETDVDDTTVMILVIVVIAIFLGGVIAIFFFVLLKRFKKEGASRSPDVVADVKIKHSNRSKQSSSAPGSHVKKKKRSKDADRSEYEEVSINALQAPADLYENSHITSDNDGADNLYADVNVQRHREEPPATTTVGDDGTIYALLDQSAKPAPPPTASERKPIVVDNSVYAAVDHSVS